MKYLEIERERIGEFDYNEKELLKEKRSQGFKLINKKREKSQPYLYGYLFERKILNDPARPKFKNIHEK